MKIGLHAATLERRYPLPDVLTHAAALGAESYEIDIGIGQPGERWPDRLGQFENLVPNLRTLAAELDLELATLCLGTLWQTSLASADPAEREQGVKVIQDICALAPDLGTSVILLPVGQPVGLDPQAARANLIDSLRRCLPAAEAQGVTLALENVCQAFLKGAAELLEVVETVNGIKIYYDLGNPSFIGHNPASELAQLAPYVARVHAKDTIPLRRAQPPLPQTPITGDFYVWQERTTVTLGEGDVDLVGLARQLDNMGYREGIIIEVPQPPERADIGSKNNLRAARRIFSSPRLDKLA